MERNAPARVRLVGEGDPPFQREVEAGLRQARTLSGMSLDDYAANMATTLKRQVTPVMVTDWETGRRPVEAVVWFAACRVADQIQSAVLGETDLVPGLFEMERIVSDLLAKVQTLA